MCPSPRSQSYSLSLLYIPLRPTTNSEADSASKVPVASSFSHVQHKARIRIVPVYRHAAVQLSHRSCPKLVLKYDPALLWLVRGVRNIGGEGTQVQYRQREAPVPSQEWLDHVSKRILRSKLESAERFLRIQRFLSPTLCHTLQ